MPLRRPRIFLDANILVDAQIRDIFLTVAEAKLIDLRWSDKVLNETRNVLTSQMGIEPSRANYLISTIDAAFPRSNVAAGNITPLPVTLPDADDLHVLSAAVSADCDLLVTNNLRDFPEGAVGPFGLSVLNADSAIAMLVQDFSDQMPTIISRLLSELRKPPVNVQEFLDRLKRRTPTAGQALSAALNG